jgi:glutamate/tyrosine decarboxylase-like PLP-dependent enzyme
LQETTKLLTEHSLYDGHPKFLGYITSSPSPIGVLGDFLASAVNPNVGAWSLAQIATEIELQSIRWIAQMIGYPRDSGGILVSGGNEANFVCFLAARRTKVDWDVRTAGMHERKRLLVYASSETHTWIQKAADLFGLGTDSIRWISTDDEMKMNISELERRLNEDLQTKDDGIPFLVVGTAGSTGTGAVDPLGQISSICRKYNLWFHVD